MERAQIEYSNAKYATKCSMYKSKSFNVNFFFSARKYLDLCLPFKNTKKVKRQNRVLEMFQNLHNSLRQINITGMHYVTIREYLSKWIYFKVFEQGILVTITASESRFVYWFCIHHKTLISLTEGVVIQDIWILQE